MGSCQFISPIPLHRRVGFALVLSLILIFAAGKAVLFDTLDPDFFWHYRVAEQLLKDGVRPLVDTISFASMKTPWTPYSWLAELGMKAIWDRFGLPGAILLQSIMVGGIFAMIALSCRHWPWRQQEDNDRLLATVLSVALAAGVSLPYLSFRPATAATLILAMIAWILLRDRCRHERTRIVWIVPLLTLICVNIHFFAIFAVLWTGSLFAGAIVELARDASDERRRRLRRYALLLGCTIAAVLATPMLPGMIQAVLKYRTNDPMVHSNQIAEMVPFWHGVGGVIVAGILLIAALCIAANVRRIRFGEFLWLAGMLVLATQMGRLLSVAVIILCPLLAWSFPKLSDRPLQLPVIRLAACGLAVVCLLRIALNLPTKDSMPTWLNRHGSDAPGYPVAAADFVEKHVTPRSHRLINEFSWGGYLAFRLGGQFQVLLDGRTQVHTPEFWQNAYLGNEHQRRQILEDANGDAAILPVNKSLFRETLISMGWNTAYKDERSEVLVPPPRLARTAE